MGEGGTRRRRPEVPVGNADERPLPPEQIADAPADKQKRPERQRMGGDHPLAKIGRKVQLSLGRRRRDGTIVASRRTISYATPTGSSTHQRRP